MHKCDNCGRETDAEEHAATGIILCADCATRRPASSGAEMIAFERQRQVDVEGYKSAHDDLYELGELAQAAACYLEAEDARAGVFGWPLSPVSWKPKDRIRNLVRAGALIAAEIDRLNRREALLKSGVAPHG